MTAPRSDPNLATSPLGTDTLETRSGADGRSGSRGGRPELVLGRMEQLMRVRLLRDPHAGRQCARTGTMTTGPWVLDPDGRPFSAAAAVIMDNTLATSLHASEPHLQWIVTTELTLNVLRPLPADGTVLESRTRTRAADGTGGMASGTLVGTDGTEYLQATGWFQGVEGNDPAAVAHFTAMAGLPLGPDTEVPLGRLLGAQPTTPAPPAGRPEVTDDFGAGWGFDRKDELRNPHGAVHGGALSMMAALAAQQAMPDRSGFELQSLRVLFLRPAGGEIASRVRVRHAGRSLRIVQVELFGAANGPGAKPFVQAEAVFRPAC
ncbi:MAG: thioesterase family protein [Micrococcus sp.]|nr:thioesterase family protein [Micrococcus sp.]